MLCCGKFHEITNRQIKKIGDFIGINQVCLIGNWYPFQDSFYISVGVTYARTNFTISCVFSEFADFNIRPWGKMLSLGYNSNAKRDKIICLDFIVGAQHFTCDYDSGSEKKIKNLYLPVLSIGLGTLI